LRLHGDCHEEACRGNHPLNPILHAELRQPVAGMKYERDHRRAHAVEDGGHRSETAKMAIERTKRADDDEVREDECPAARPCAPEPAAKIRDEDPDLDGE